MRRRFSTPAVVGLLSLSALGTAVRGAEPAPDGRTLFQRRCGICHLADGGGTWMLGRRLGAEFSLLERRTDLQPPFIKYVVRHGLQAMPRFTRVDVSEVELDAIAAYLAAPKAAP